MSKTPRIPMTDDGPSISITLRFGDRFLKGAMPALLAATGSLAAADTMECYNGIIDSAASNPPDKQVVQRRCGEPREKRDQGNQWVYHKRPFTYVLRFDENGVLIDIQASEE